jgi:uncharacterized protein YndB with AHSA1/START domain
LVVLALLVIAYLIPAPPVHRSATAEVHSSREKVWEALSDLEHIPTWNGAARLLEFAGTQRQGNGTRYRVPGTPISRTFEVTDWRPYNRIDYRVTTEPGVTYDHTLSFRIRPLYDRAAIQLDEDYRLRGGYLGHLFDQLYLGPSVERGRAAALANLKRWIETGSEVLLP